ncbi:peptidylprolyl isomerase [Qipengyuania soli]|uniref:peptidylprolyl isomerase n=1 Tax=Qipengyuania soli TaxID=2782568 RepID=A0A7S8IWM6_9SPHN|nr:peptidylprolyl isomerase [Qipengyuania soli]QPD00187.1 peptidylprolyl isomerase [Qipengyuania soli]
MTWIARALAVLALFATPLAAQDSGAPPEPRTDRVILSTTAGDITVAIETERAPITAANFLRYVDEKRFDGIVFYRAMRLDWDEQPNGLIQAGTQYDPDRTLEPIAHEPTSQTGVLHKRGTLSMARYAPGSATGDFSILLRALPSMDADPDNADPDRQAGFAAFGHVVEGMDVVEAIHAMPTDPDKGDGWMKGQMLAEPVKIVTARRVDAD